MLCLGYNNIYIDQPFHLALLCYMILLIQLKIKQHQHSMQCDCRSKDLYRNYDKLTFTIDGKQMSQARKLTQQQISPQNSKILKLIYENSQIYLPSTIDSIHSQQIYANPLWFYKNYIAMNKPCIITDAIDGQICEKWSNPQEFGELVRDMPQVSVSVTPDGFADSIKGEYFLEPLEIKSRIKDVIEWKDQKKQNNHIKSDWIPYIQHQNSNLTQQLEGLVQHIDGSFKQFVSEKYFDGNEPDASNFWMGYRDSVSSLHKDPYENFYTTITGEKHFTLLPPTSISFLHEEAYKSARYKISQSQKLTAITDPKSQYETTRWIACNPDLEDDVLFFPQLKKLEQNKYHIVLEAGQTLYLPSLWYHQVSQTHHKIPYTIAVNYWFDMNFGPNYGLYQTARRLKGYP